MKAKENISEKKSIELGSEDKQELNPSSAVGLLHGLQIGACFLSETGIFV